MKKLFYLVVFSLCASSYADLVVYTYDSVTGKGSLGEIIEKEWVKQSKTRIKWVPFGSSGEAVGQFLLEGKKTTADILLGLDASQTVQAEKGAGFHTYPKSLELEVVSDAWVDGAGRFLPFDYGYLAFVYDSSRTKEVPKSLKDLSENPSFLKKVVIEDPRTSSLGLGFLVWANHQKALEPLSGFWKHLSPQLVTISPSWSAAYGMFLKKEADFVLSYTTSPAYHVQQEKKTNFKSVVFEEGHYRQTELAAIVATTKQKVEAEAFLKLLVSKEVQEEVALRQWMYPVRKDVKLPASFEGISKPKSVTVDFKLVELKRKSWVQEWLENIVKKP